MIMWIKFNGSLVNFDHVRWVVLIDQEEGSLVRLDYHSDCFMAERFSTPRAAQDRFNELAGMLTNRPIVPMQDPTAEDAKKLAAIMDRVNR